MRIGDPPSHDQAPSGAFDSKASSPPHLCCQCAEYSSRISDLENRLTLAKRQAQATIDKASKACFFEGGDSGRESYCNFLYITKSYVQGIYKWQ
jgi:hypothetical protein